MAKLRNWRFWFSHIVKYVLKPEYRFKVLTDKSCELNNYQKLDLKSLAKVLYKKSKKPSQLYVLDIGCASSEVKFLSKFVKHITGINYDLNHSGSFEPSAKFSILKMDATNLVFEDNSFDIAYSFNLYEHVSDIDKCLDEQIRVIKSGGFGYAKWSPIWSGPKGHHIHEDMVEYWEKVYEFDKSNYKNDGTFIPDWGHLIYNKEELNNILSEKINNKDLIVLIIETIYNSMELNRLYFDDFKKLLFSKNIVIELFEKTECSEDKEMLNLVNLKFKSGDYTTYGCELIFSKP
jgi:ubiquinone/menaquinone biosynthesis C-methylase UbiE